MLRRADTTIWRLSYVRWVRVEKVGFVVDKISNFFDTAGALLSDLFARV